MRPDRPGQSDFGNNQHALPRSHVVEIIAQGQEDILRQLRAEGIPETEALKVIRRFNEFAVQILRELDSLYREFETLLAHDPDRSQEHQAWLETKAGGLLLTLEAMIAALVAEAINKAKDDYRSELSHPREVITMPPAGPSLWEEARENSKRLILNPVVLWSVGLPLWFLMWLLMTQSIIWALITIGITAVAVLLFKKAGVLFSITVGGVYLLLLLLSL